MRVENRGPETPAARRIEKPHAGDRHQRRGHNHIVAERGCAGFCPVPPDQPHVRDQARYLHYDDRMFRPEKARHKRDGDKRQSHTGQPLDESAKGQPERDYREGVKIKTKFHSRSMRPPGRRINPSGTIRPNQAGTGLSVGKTVGYFLVFGLEIEPGGRGL